MSAEAWFRCYLPPCLGIRRTDTTWQRHYARAHHGTDARAIAKPGRTDLLPLGSEPSGREAYRVARDALTVHNRRDEGR